MTKERLVYLPLGGAGEIGMNAYVYGYGPKDNERFILVDLGVTFPDMDGSPGVDLIFPDISWLAARKDRLDAIFITHAHEDHVGALGHLWAELEAPIYARAFTAHIARHKMADRFAPEREVTTVQPWPEMTNAGPFKVGFLPISHSIPESSGLVIETPAGKVIHTGDFKIDETPVVGEAFDAALWKKASKGAHAMVCDSTNVMSPHEGRSEATLAAPITELIADAKGMVIATTFASNIARVKTLAEAGKSAGRSICLMGRAMRRMVEAGLQTGVLADFPTTISPEDAVQMPRENVMLIVTGSQGERRAASAQLSQGKYQGVTLAEGDLFLFSSKTIPGNESSVIRIMNNLSEKGVEVEDDHGGLYHVSGHANRPDLLKLQQIVNPKIVIPMHGEHRHLRKHAQLAIEAGRSSITCVNGMLLDITGDKPVVADYVETGRRYLDGAVQIGALDGVVRDRIRMALNGHVIVTVIIDEEGAPLGDPWCDLKGLPEMGRSGAPLADALEEDLSQFIGRAKHKTMSDDDNLTRELTKAARKTCLDEIGKKPEVSVVISRLM